MSLKNVHDKNTRTFALKQLRGVYLFTQTHFSQSISGVSHRLAITATHVIFLLFGTSANLHVGAGLAENAD